MSANNQSGVPELEKMQKTDEAWRKELTPEQYRVLREKSTEGAFTGEYYASKDKGVYVCAACGNKLFSSDLKFDSGTGWPSFAAPASGDVVATDIDKSHGMERVEVKCSRCGGHLGHVFDDGPKAMPDGKLASGKRFCINSCALKLEKDSSL